MGDPMNDDFRFAFALVAFLLAVIDLVRSRGQSLPSWGLGLLSLALITFWWPEGA